MKSREHPYPLTVEGSYRYTGLEMAQTAALPAVARALVEVLRENGWRGHSDCGILGPGVDHDAREMSIRTG
jgi:hypothetical protein